MHDCISMRAMFYSCFSGSFKKQSLFWFLILFLHYSSFLGFYTSIYGCFLCLICRCLLACGFGLCRFTGSHAPRMMKVTICLGWLCCTGWDMLYMTTEENVLLAQITLWSPLQKLSQSSMAKWTFEEQNCLKLHVNIHMRIQKWVTDIETHIGSNA